MPLNIDLDDLLRPLGDECPCGPNLEYSPEFLLLEEAARPQGSQEFTGDDGRRITIDGQDANWPEVRRLSEELLARTRDLRVAVYFTRALLRTEGFRGLRPGLRLILGYVENHWPQLHPELDAEDDNDPTMRLNALAPLLANEAVLGDLRASRLLGPRQSGGLSIRDIEVAQGRIAARENEQILSGSQLDGMLAEAIAADPELVATITDTHDLVGQLSTALQQVLGADGAIDFAPLQVPLAAIRSLLPSGTLPDTGQAHSAESTMPADHASSAERSCMPGEIRSRADISAIIDRLVAHLERTEPTNPAQWLLRRAQRVMNMNFLEAIVELAPDALEQTERMVGGQLNRPEG